MFHPNFDFSRIKTNLSFTRQLKLFREILIFLLIGVGMVFAVQKLNKKWEKSILDQISIYEPQLNWLDTSLSFQNNEANARQNFELGAKELDEVENKESQFDSLALADDVRYEVESDVVLTSWDALPKDFDAVELEQSEYEELKARGYRDSRYGNTKVYRVLMRSVDTNDSKVKLKKSVKLIMLNLVSKFLVAFITTFMYLEKLWMTSLELIMLNLVRKSSRWHLLQPLCKATS